MHAAHAFSCHSLTLYHMVLTVSCVAVPARCPAGTQRITLDETGASKCQPCADDEYNLRRNGVCAKCPDNTVANPQRTKCDACANGHLQTSTSGQDLACNACMLTFRMDLMTKKCVPDESDKADDTINKTISTDKGGNNNKVSYNAPKFGSSKPT